MRVHRKQFPVGQGGLHAELVEFNGGSVVMVYDCGSVSASGAKKGRRPVEREIDLLAKFVGRKEIDYLILSHLHEDHINGIAYLKQQNWKVKHLVLPYTTAQEKIFYAAALISNNAAGLANFVLNPGGYFQDTLVIEISSDAENGEVDENGLGNLNGQKGQFSNAAYRAVGNHCGWGVALFNYRNPQVSQWIAQQNLPNIGRWDGQTQQLAVEVYKAACKKFGLNNFNLTSLCAFSGCLLDCDCWIEARRDCCRGMRNERHGWIHTGDILLRGHCLQEFTTFFSSYFNRTGAIQVPHHGSKNGYDIILNSQPCTSSVVCVGEKNSHKHPNVGVLHKVIQQNGKLVFVTDNSETAYEDVLICVC